jgi:RNA polymerase sigma-70 factor, ECF subfamily
VNVPSVPPDSGEQHSRSGPRSQVSSGRETESARLVELITLSSRGHDEAFAELCDLTSQRVYGIILRVLRSPDHAAEVMQEVYVEVWRQSARYSLGKRQSYCLDDHDRSSARGGSGAVGCE